MKTIITILFLSVCSFAIGQSVTGAASSSLIKPAKDSVRASALQVQKLQEKDAKVSADVKDFNESLELISGYKIEDIESWKVENGYFKFVIKTKKK